MRILILVWHEKNMRCHIYDEKKKYIVVTKNVPTFSRLLEVLASTKPIPGKILVVFGMRRFSMVRQAAIVANIFAYAWSIPIGKIILEENPDPSVISNALKNWKIKYAKVIAPSYAFSPNITKRKKND